MEISGIIELEVQNGIGILSINNEAQNKIKDPEFIDLEFLKGWVSENSIRGLIITGKGRHFSSGADVDRMMTFNNDAEKVKDNILKGHRLLDYIEQLPIPTAAAIGGICFGAGLEIALACHFRICAENAVLAFPESNIGLMPGLGGTIRLPRLIGKSKAIQMIVSGSSLNATEALTLGLADIVCPKKMELEKTKEWLQKMLDNKSYDIVTAIIHSVQFGLTHNHIESVEYESNLFSQRVKKKVS